MFQLHRLVQYVGGEYVSALYPAYSIPRARREDFPLNSDEDDLLSQARTWTYQPFSPEGRDWSATQFFGTLLYVNVCLPDNVLDPIDPRLEFSSLKCGRHCYMRTRDVRMWRTDSSYLMRPPHFSGRQMGSSYTLSWPFHEPYVYGSARTVSLQMLGPLVTEYSRRCKRGFP